MLIRFTVGNYRSFGEPKTLDLSASDDTPSLDNYNTFGKQRICNSAVLYGANASGKSNLLKALSEMRRLVLDSAKDIQKGEPLGVRQNVFIASKEQSGASLSIELVSSENQCYSYSFEVNDSKVLRERLDRITGSKKINVFNRELNKLTTKDENLKYLRTNKWLRENALVVSQATQMLNHPECSSIVKAFQQIRILSGPGDSKYINESFDMARTVNFKPLVLALLQAADKTIEDVEVVREKFSFEDFMKNMMKREAVDLSHIMGGNEPIENKVYIYRKKGRIRRRFELNEDESGGVQRLFSLAGPMLRSLNVKGGILVVDEFNSHLHTLISHELIRFFQQLAFRFNSQFIFTTHDTNLLDSRLFNPDQIWFTEMDQNMNTDLYSLVEFKQEGGEVNFEADYLMGRYGAIPFPGLASHRGKALWDSEEEKERAIQEVLNKYSK